MTPPSPQLCAFSPDGLVHECELATRTDGCSLDSSERAADMLMKIHTLAERNPRCPVPAMFAGTRSATCSQHLQRDYGALQVDGHCVLDGRAQVARQLGPSNALRSPINADEGSTRRLSSSLSRVTLLPVISRTWTSAVPGCLVSTFLSAPTLSGVHNRVGIATDTGLATPTWDRSGTARSLAISEIRSSRIDTRALTSTTESSTTSMPYTAYDCGKKSTSIPPVRSSSCADAHARPFLLMRRFTEARMPPTVT